MTNFYKTHPLTDTLADGTEVHLVLPIERTGNRPLYTSSQGKPYSHVRVLNKQTGTHEWIYREQVPIMDTTPVNRFNGHRKQRYHKMSHFGNIFLSHAVALAWIGPQPGTSSRQTGGVASAEKGNQERYECHHLNGITLDNRADNLIWLSHKEHRLFDTVQRALRMAGRDLTKMSREEIISITRKYRLVDPAEQMEYEMTHHCEC